MLAAGCRRSGSQLTTKFDGRRSANHIQEAVERSGGRNVWVKTPRHLASRAGFSREVLAAPSAFDAVLPAIHRECRRLGLETRVSVEWPGGGWRRAEIHVLLRGEPVGRWQLREVPRLRRAAIVIDDLGADFSAARKILELPCPLAVSVLPQLRHSTEVAREAHRRGREVMLHLPMQAEPASRVEPGRGELRVGMSGDRVCSVIERDLASVPFSSGVNNHMGSRATADPRLMENVMKVLARRHLYFVDSRTTSASVALDSARRQGVPAFYRSVFLDDTESVGYSLRQLRKFRRLVEEHGVALAIGHPHPTTLAALAQFCPEFERADIQLVPPSQLVRGPEAAYLRPPTRTDGLGAP